jgi:hypothetical protein
MSGRVRAFVLASAAVIVTFLCLPAPAAAQSYQPRHEGVGVGVKGGPLFASFDSNITGEEFDHRTAFIGGLFLGGNLPGVFGAQVELLYARKGANVADSDSSITADYLEVPVLLRINAGSPNLTGGRVYGLVGPTFDIRLRSHLNTGESLDDQISSGDVGIAVGLGVELTRFLVEGRYTRGLKNIDKSFGTTGETLKSSTVAIFVGFRFN